MVQPLPVSVIPGASGWVDPVTLAAYQALGLPAGWEDYIYSWVERDLGIADVAPYTTARGDRRLDPAWIGDYAVHGLPAAQALAYLDAGATDGTHLWSMWKSGCPATVARAWLGAETGADAEHASRLLAAVYTVALAFTSRRDIVNAFMAVAPRRWPGCEREEVLAALHVWDGPTWRTLPAARIVALHLAGCTPCDVIVDPNLATCPIEELLTLAALTAPLGA